MPHQQSAKGVQKIIHDATAEPTIDLLAELAEPLAEYIIEDYALEDWQDSPVVEAMARVAAILEAQGREVPPPLLAVLRKASEAGHPIGVA